MLFPLGIGTVAPVLIFPPDPLFRGLVKLSNYERIKKMTLLADEMTLEGGQLTPSLKVKRRVVNQMYAKQIEAMYSEPKA
jgi:long-subunit acyl-CoA synthetase (AMP-forming)